LIKLREGENIKLKVLIDNNTYIDQYCCSEPAASYYIEDGDVRLLLDVGYSDLFLKNANALGVDLKKVNTIVIYPPNESMEIEFRLDIDEIDYSPFEEHFWLFEKKSKLTEEDLINEINRMEQLGCDKKTIKKLKSEPYTITLVLLVNKEYADKHGYSPRTGESYIINITKENLKDFIKKLKFKYETLISNI